MIGNIRTAGQRAYEAELSVKPAYLDGSPRKSWNELSDIAKWSWERNPTPRWTPDLTASDVVVAL